MELIMFRMKKYHRFFKMKGWVFDFDLESSEKSDVFEFLPLQEWPGTCSLSPLTASASF